MQLEKRGDSNYSHVIVQGDVDMYSSHELWKLGDAEIGAGKRRILLDFAGVNYLDSSGVGIIIRLLQKAKTTNARMALTGLNGTPLRVLQLSNIIALITVIDDPASAEAFLKE